MSAVVQSEVVNMFFQLTILQVTESEVVEASENERRLRLIVCTIHCVEYSM